LHPQPRITGGIQVKQAMKTTLKGLAAAMASQSNTDSTLTVFIIIGRAWAVKGGEPEEVHVLLTAPDEDSAVRNALNGLAEEGYEECELDQIGLLEDAPEEEPHISAYQGALEGEIAIVRFGEE
jgi:hypothetical protein